MACAEKLSPTPFPALLLADEPTGNLDSRTAADVFALLRRFNRKFGCAVLLVTHDSRLSDVCDRTLTLADGLIVSDQATGRVQVPDRRALTRPTDWRGR